MSPSRPLSQAVPAAAAVYVVTVAGDGRAHVAPTDAVVDPDGRVVVTDVGRRTAANVAAGSALTLVWSTGDPREYTVIVDGTGVLEGDRCVVSPRRAVRHRRGPGGDGADAPDDVGHGCTSDCVELGIG